MTVSLPERPGRRGSSEWPRAVHWIELYLPQPAAGSGCLLYGGCFSGYRRRALSSFYSSDFHQPETDLEGDIDPHHRCRIEGAHAPPEQLAVIDRIWLRMT